MFVLRVQSTRRVPLYVVAQVPAEVLVEYGEQEHKLSIHVQPLPTTIQNALSAHDHSPYEPRHGIPGHVDPRGVKPRDAVRVFGAWSGAWRNVPAVHEQRVGSHALLCLQEQAVGVGIAGAGLVVQQSVRVHRVMAAGFVFEDDFYDVTNFRFNHRSHNAQMHVVGISWLPGGKGEIGVFAIYRLLVFPSYEVVVVSGKDEISGIRNTGRKEMFYLTTLSTHFIYGYMASDRNTRYRN